MTIYTNKKTGIAYKNLISIDNGKFQLTQVDDENCILTTTESMIKRWFKKSIEVDFTNAEEKPAEETKSTSKKSSKKTTATAAKKTHKPRAKTYEEQKWGLGHTRMSIDAFCKLFELDSIEYDIPSKIVAIQIGSETVARRRAWKNELTGSVWFRFKNYEYELTDVDYDTGVQVA